jgi:hypothetical protein
MSWAKIKRQQAREADALAAVAAGIGEYGIANSCYRLAAILMRQAIEQQRFEDSHDSKDDVQDGA